MILRLKESLYMSIIIFRINVIVRTLSVDLSGAQVHPVTSIMPEACTDKLIFP